MPLWEIDIVLGEDMEFEIDEWKFLLWMILDVMLFAIYSDEGNDHNEKLVYYWSAYWLNEIFDLLAMII